MKIGYKTMQKTKFVMQNYIIQDVKSVSEQHLEKLVNKRVSGDFRNAETSKRENRLGFPVVSGINIGLRGFFVMQVIMQDFIMQFFNSALRIRPGSLMYSGVQGFFIMQIDCTTKCITEIRASLHKYWVTRLFRNTDFPIYINIYSRLIKSLPEKYILGLHLYFRRAKNSE